MFELTFHALLKFLIDRVIEMDLSHVLSRFAWFALLIGCTSDPSKALLNVDDAEWSREAPASFEAKFTTSKGAFIVEVHKDWSPLGVNRFYNLVRLGYFDDSRFYRVRKDFIVQFGIAGNPNISQVWEKEEIKDDPVVESNLRGFVSYAMTGPDTRTTQLFINLVDNARLDAEGFSPIGLISSGMDVVDRIYNGYDESAGGGMRGGKQQKLFELGNEYLDANFPKLDKLIKAEIIEP